MTDPLKGLKEKMAFESKEWKLGPASWAPKGRLVAFEPKDVTVNPTIKVVEKEALERLQSIVLKEVGELVEALEYIEKYAMVSTPLEIRYMSIRALAKFRGGNGNK